MCVYIYILYIYIYIYIYISEKFVFFYYFIAKRKHISKMNGFIYFYNIYMYTCTEEAKYILLAQKKLPKWLRNICRIKCVLKLIHT